MSDTALTLNGPKDFNLLLTILVVIGGAFIARVINARYRTVDQRSLFHSYVFWWIAWAIWIPSWLALAFMERAGIGADLKRLLSLIFSDVNSILLIISALFLLQGKKLKAVDGFFLTIGFCGIALISYTALYYSFGWQAPVASQIHENLAMCLAAVAPVLLGWALYQRFSSLLPLGAALIYGILQSAAFVALLHPDDYSGELGVFAKLLLLLGFMKVAFACGVTYPFVIEADRTGAKRFPLEFWAQLGILVAVSIVFPAWAAKIDVKTLTAAIGVLGGALAIIQGSISLISRVVSG